MRSALLLVAALCAVGASAQPANLGPNQAVTRLDLRLSAGGGLLAPGSQGIVEAEASMMVASPFLGPFVVQFGGGVGTTPTDAGGTQPDEIARMTAGVGLVKDLGTVRNWVLVNVWTQTRGREWAPAVSLTVGLDAAVAERVSVFGMVRGLAGDVRAPEGETGRTATAQVGAAIRL